MSKKKVCSTMSLKDFHGGAIPSDLPLPSAPGVVAIPGSDRSASANWGNNLMRTDLRPRPKSSGASRGFDEKGSLLSHPSPPIGRNFDEDERKPLDGLSAPRRTISDESIQRSAAVVHQEVKLDYPSSVSVHDRPLSSPGIQSPSLGTGLRSVAGFAGIDQAVNSSKASGAYNGQGVNNNPPNAWGVKKEVSEYVAPSPLGTSPISKLAQASAIDKVSSGMWQSKNPTNLLPHLLYAKDNVITQGGGGRGAYDPTRGIQTENDLLTEDRNRGFGREYPSYGRDQTPRPREDGYQLPQTVLPVSSDQVKPKPYQRSTSLETSEVEYRQGFQHATQPGQAEIIHGLHGEASSPKQGPIGGKTNTRPAEKPVERPKLNLKPRSQPREQSEGNAVRERNSLFGGARPRELVLKERGVDDIEINKIDHPSPSPKRVNSLKIEVKSEHSGPAARQGPTKSEVRTPTNRGRTGGREFERKDHQKADHNEKPEQERKSWRNDKWKGSNKEVVVNHNNKEQQRPEPETWRKPIEERNSSTSSEGAGHGKLVSALELAQAFSKSVSVSKNNSEPPRSPHRGGPVRQNNDKNGSQVLFSRLTETRSELYPAPSTARHRVNGY
ncbi:unnamed protein product [Linum trigynum]|uniref:Uncharacterized protein n=1 Tax=Linum trigynum TaxID=586398 RepID=A0AAV2G895_9ROSI